MRCEWDEAKRRKNIAKHGIEIDLSETPELTGEELAAMRPSHEVIPGLHAPRKQRITIRLDQEIVQFFKEQAQDTGASYQSPINAVLRNYVAHVHSRTDLRSLVREIVQEELAHSRQEG